MTTADEMLARGDGSTRCAILKPSTRSPRMVARWPTTRELSGQTGGQQSSLSGTVGRHQPDRTWQFQPCGRGVRYERAPDRLDGRRANVIRLVRERPSGWPHLRRLDDRVFERSSSCNVQ